MTTSDNYPTTEQFLREVLMVAKECGYGWLNKGAHHPEDIVINLAPIMQAYAVGWGAGYRKGWQR